MTHYIREHTERNPRIQARPVEVRKCYGEVYAKSSVLVHPSLSEGFGYVVAEAMASGIPMTDSGTPRRIIRFAVFEFDPGTGELRKMKSRVT